MRLLIAVDKYTGGAGNVAQQLASLFSHEEGYEVGLILLNTKAKPKYDLSKVEIIDRHSDYGGHIALPKAVVRWFKEHYRLGCMINQWHPDVIVSFLNSISVPLLISQWNTKTPIIVSERSDPYFEWRNGSKTFNFQWWLSYKRANMIVYQFHHFEPFFKSQYMKGKTMAIPNMLYGYKNLNVADNDNSGIVHFVTLASLYYAKRIDLMIDIFAEIHRRCPNTDLNIYGDGEDRLKLERKVMDMGLADIIHFNGTVTDTYSVLAGKNIFLLTSEREGFPNSVIEAMSMGVVPVIFRFHQGISEIIQDGENGFLIPENDQELFVDKSCALVKDKSLRDDMGDKAKCVINVYGENCIADKWRVCINSISSKISLVSTKKS